MFTRIMGRASRHLGLHIYRITVRDIGSHAPVAIQASGVVLREAQKEELIAYSDLKGIEMSDDFVRTSFSHGERIFCAFSGAEIVGYAMSAVGLAQHVDGIWIVTSRDFAFSFKVYVDPDYRGRKLGPALIQLGDNEMRRAGFSKRIGFSSLENWSSKQMSAHIGARTVGFAGYMKLFGRLRTFSSRGARRVRFRFVERTALGD